MSANFDKVNKNWLMGISKDNIISPLDEAVIQTVFEQESDEDEKIINLQIKQEIYLRKICLLNILIFPIEWVLTRLIFDKQYTELKTKAVKIDLLLYRRKINIEEFRKQHMSIKQLAVIK